MPGHSQDSVRVFAQRQAVERLDRLAYELARVRRKNSAGAVHDLRVSVRRFLACLDGFRDAFPNKARRKIKADLRELMKLAGEARDRDIALELAAEAGLDADAPIAARWRRERDDFARLLDKELKSTKRAEVAKRWRKELRLL